MTIAKIRYTFLILPLLACEAPADGPTPREAWSKHDRPSLLGPDFVYVLDELPAEGEVERTPWPGSYWPTYRDSINYRWAGGASAAKKYGLAFGVEGVEDAVSERFGVDSRDGDDCDSDLDCVEGLRCGKRAGSELGVCIPFWHGICDAWAAAAILEEEPRRSVTYNGIKFHVNDLKALITLAYTDDVKMKFMSLRCDQAAEGGDLEDESECEDTNPGSFHVALANLIGLRGQSLVEDRTFDVEVWNHPLISYKVEEIGPIGGKEANQLLGGGELVRVMKDAGEVGKGELQQVGDIDVEPGQTLRVRTTGTGDVDLYVRWNQEPSLSHHDCRPFEKDSKETCELVAPGYVSDAHIAVRGYGVDSTYAVMVEVRDEPTDEYAFNDEAKSLRRVKTEVAYVDESPLSDDGHLSDDIGHYTRTTEYEYVLELDGKGKIIGGEWLGASKTEHPDFLYLPVKKLPGKVAKGKIVWSEVQKLLELAK
jgi:hypothetical protein